MAPHAAKDSNEQLSAVACLTGSQSPKTTPNHFGHLKQPIQAYTGMHVIANVVGIVAMAFRITKCIYTAAPT
jgi:hypothetical protein